MKNSLQYYYEINVQEIRKINNDYYFEHQNNNFVVMQYFRDPNEVNEILELNKYMLTYLNTYRIIINKENSILFEYNNLLYILMIVPNINNRFITLEDILSSKKSNKEYKAIDKSNWDIAWSNKIDYIEKQFLENKNKYTIIKESINYYIGLWENAIAYFNNLNKEEKYISHFRISTNTTILEYLNPLNLIIDYNARDIGEYVKSYVMSNNYSLESLKSIFNKINMNKDLCILIISRILFPSYYFDRYENIYLDKEKEEVLNEIIKKRTNINKLLLFLFDKYKTYNIPIIDWVYKDLE